MREGIELAGESVELLLERTEGWPAGLYLAALWLRDLEDPDEGVRAFAGSARHVADYLTDEVLTALAPQIREFLLRTSVLGRFTPELCDAVLGREDSAAVLAELVRSNMFLVALDARGEWYRYHHLFGELLQLELGRERRACAAPARGGLVRAHGLIEDAIEYAAAAGDADTVAELLVEHHLEFIWGGRIEQFLGWVRWLPSELLLEHPSLPAAGAFAAAVARPPRGGGHAAACGGGARAAGAAAAVVAVRRGGRGSHACGGDRAGRRGRGRRARSPRGRGRPRRARTS